MRRTRKWLEGAAGLRQETVTMSFAKSADKRADELISGSLILYYTIALRSVLIIIYVLQLYLLSFNTLLYSIIAFPVKFNPYGKRD